MEPRPEAAPVPVPEPRQRWRLLASRSVEASAAPQRDLAASWEDAVARSGLPAVRMSDGRPKVVFGAPAPSGVPGEGELIDVLVTERLPRWRVREALEDVAPPGWTILDVADVWLGTPSLAGSVVAADHRVAVSGDLGVAAIRAAAVALLAERTLPRERPKGATTVAYDLRPLLIDIAVADAGPPLRIRIRTRIHPTLGTGRPEEVVAAIADRAGVALAVESIVRERLLLADEIDEA